MSMYDGFLPKDYAGEYQKGKRGYYPVCSAEEWDKLPAVYKAMEWFPIEVYNERTKAKETTVVEYVEFNVVYMMPYRVSATVRVHVQEVQKILFCLFEDTPCHLYTISGVVFANGERYGAKWLQDATTGAFAVYADGHCVGMQGGYRGFIPCQIERKEDGSWKWAGYKPGNRCHYELLNPFSGK